MKPKQKVIQNNERLLEAAETFREKGGDPVSHLQNAGLLQILVGAKDLKATIELLLDGAIAMNRHRSRLKEHAEPSTTSKAILEDWRTIFDPSFLLEFKQRIAEAGESAGELAATGGMVSTKQAESFLRSFCNSVSRVPERLAKQTRLRLHANPIVEERKKRIANREKARDVDRDMAARYKCSGENIRRIVRDHQIKWVPVPGFSGLQGKVGPRLKSDPPVTETAAEFGRSLGKIFRAIRSRKDRKE